MLQRDRQLVSIAAGFLCNLPTVLQSCMGTFITSTLYIKSRVKTVNTVCIGFALIGMQQKGATVESIRWFSLYRLVVQRAKSEHNTHREQGQMCSLCQILKWAHSPEHHKPQVTLVHLSSNMQDIGQALQWQSEHYNLSAAQQQCDSLVSLTSTCHSAQQLSAK